MVGFKRVLRYEKNNLELRYNNIYFHLFRRGTYNDNHLQHNVKIEALFHTSITTN